MCSDFNYHGYNTKTEPKDTNRGLSAKLLYLRFWKCSGKGKNCLFSLKNPLNQKIFRYYVIKLCIMNLKGNTCSNFLKFEKVSLTIVSHWNFMIYAKKHSARNYCNCIFFYKVLNMELLSKSVFKVKNKNTFITLKGVQKVLKKC